MIEKFAFANLVIISLIILGGLVKTQKNVTPAQIFIGINSSRSPDDVPAKAGNHLKTLDSRFHGNDDNRANRTFYEFIILGGFLLLNIVKRKFED